MTWQTPERLRSRRRTTASKEAEGDAEHGERHDEMNQNTGQKPRVHAHRAPAKALKPSSLLLVTLFCAGLLARNPLLIATRAPLFNEAHVARLAQSYFTRAFHLDSQPPFAKLLFAFAATLGSPFSFNFSTRFLAALASAALVPVLYATCRAVALSQLASVMVASLLLFENSVIAYTQLAMVESPFLLCNGLALLFWLRFMGTSATAFSKAWWPPLLLAGIFLGLSMSSKWSTLFLVASFCLVAMQDLWSLASDRLFSPSTILRHVFARILCLVVIPSVIYVGVFWIHFALLSSTGNGAKYMTPEVQVSLKGAKNPEFFANVSYGSYISLRHEASPCGYVTSGSSRYLKGSQMHTVWCGAKDDSSAMFSIEHRYIMNSGGIENPPTHPEELLKDGDIIRLKHTNTLRWLRSHDFRPALQNNTAQSEVCTHGDPKTSDFDDLWQIETAPRNAPVRAMQTRLRLVHFQRKCSLMSRTFKNGSYSEVSCVQNKERVGTVWRIEGNRNPKYPAGAQKIRYKPAGFWSKFMETQRHMLETFSNTTRTHPYVSNPLDWPIARRGVAVWHDPKSPAQIFVLGNPVVSIATTGSVVLCVIFVAVLWVAAQRHVPLSNATIEQLTSAEQILVLVFCNYVPFFFAKTELFLHDGFPALYAAFLCVGLIFDAFTLRFRSPSRIVMAGVLVACVLFAFVKWSALTYGFPMSVEQCEGLKWRKAWDWFCREAPEGSTRPSAAAFP